MNAHIQGDPDVYEVWLVPVDVPPDPQGYTKHWRIELHDAGVPCFVFCIRGKVRTWYNKAQARNEAKRRLALQSWEGVLLPIPHSEVS